MKNNTENVVAKRSCIDNGTLKEMNSKYPKVTVKGVEYDLGLTYITLQTDYINDTAIRKLVKTYGAEIIAVICFFRMKMCQPYGWYCRVDGDNLDTLIEDCAYALKMEEEKVKECYQALIEQQAFYVISDETGTYLTDVQQLYNFEILNNNRLRERQRKQAAREKAKAEAEKKKKEAEKAEQSKSAPATVREEPAEQNAPEDDPFKEFENDSDPLEW